MGDNTLQTGGDNIATDELTTLNGASQSSPLPKAERVKPIFGPDGSGTDVSDTSPLPVSDRSPPFSNSLGNSGVDVLASSTIVVAVNTARTKVYITNGSDTGIWLRPSSSGVAAVVGVGYYLAPGGVHEEFTTTGYTAIHGGTGSKRVGVTEF